MEVLSHNSRFSGTLLDPEHHISLHSVLSCELHSNCICMVGKYTNDYEYANNCEYVSGDKYANEGRYANEDSVNNSRAVARYTFEFLKGTVLAPRLGGGGCLSFSHSGLLARLGEERSETRLALGWR